MWEESWPNLLMKMRDLPYYKYKSKSDKPKNDEFDDSDAKPGDIEILKTKFAKYMQK
jgi:hypothetical protein